MNPTPSNCPRCGQPLLPASRFCGVCGYHLPEKRRPFWLWLVSGALVLALSVVAIILLTNKPGSQPPTFEELLAAKGGTRVILEIDAPVDSPEKKEVERALPTLRKRLAAAGYQGQVEVSDKTRISVTLLADIDLSLVLDLLTDPGLLEIVDTGDTPFQPGDYVFTDFSSTASRAASTNDIIYHTILTNDEISTAAVEYQQNFDTYQITFKLTPQAAQIFSDFTAAHLNQYATIVYNHLCISSPRIVTQISDGTAIIQGHFTAQQAGQVAAALIGGALPYPLKIIETTTLSPSSR